MKEVKKLEKASDIFGEAFDRLVKVEFLKNERGLNTSWFRVEFKGNKEVKGVQSFLVYLNKFNEKTGEEFRNKISSREFKMYQKYGFLRIEIEKYCQEIWDAYVVWKKGGKVGFEFKS